MRSRNAQQRHEPTPASGMDGDIEAAGNAAQPDSHAQSSPLQSMLRVWNLITATSEMRSRDQETLQQLQALEQANSNLKKEIEQLTQREARARYLANHDGLTGLCNRSLLMDRFVQASAHADRCGHPMALLLFDLDGFKEVNDRFGHMVGDRLLQRIAEHLGKVARAGDTVCRYGGDEFVMLMPGIDSLANARQVAQRVSKRIADCLRMDDIPVKVSASCGIALYPDDGDNWHNLMEAADIAMYDAKPREQKDDVAYKTRERRAPTRYDRAPQPDSTGANFETGANSCTDAPPRPSRKS